MTESRASVRYLERSLAPGGRYCLACILELRHCRWFVIFHHQIDLQVHLIEFLLICHNACGLVLLLQLEVRLELVDLRLEHFNQKLKGVGDLIR